jgi:hypothetical protein
VDEMRGLFEAISGLIDASERDLGRIERTLTDGYAQALSIEAENHRLERRMTELVHALRQDETGAKTTELTRLAEQRDGNAGDLTKLRSALADLRRHADSLR